MSTDRKVRLTPEGKVRLENELKHLDTVRMPELSQRIQDATEHGDITDNSEYEEMKEEYMHLESRVYDLTQTLENAEIIEAGSGDGTVQLGSRLTVRDDDGTEEVWILVNSAEASSSENRVSAESPAGKALYGKRAGDDATVQTPGGALTYSIINVE
ncbi:MAG: transcription elongation factor GreA [Chloroflexia bacterium]|jgi:transcription elongation factor GreA|nr:transcription elongation factor GreA [Chloroflexia bacterium]MDQ3523611.1 transcription elongation factor GreA [Chloroflexota bacterium]